jgi:hypothetical protein
MFTVGYHKTAVFMIKVLGRRCRKFLIIKNYYSEFHLVFRSVKRSCLPRCWLLPPAHAERQGRTCWPHPPTPQGSSRQFWTLRPPGQFKGLSRRGPCFTFAKGLSHRCGILVKKFFKNIMFSLLKNRWRHLQPGALLSVHCVGSMYSQDVEYCITFTVWFLGVCWTVFFNLMSSSREETIATRYI